MVITDYRMPQMSGLDFLKKIREKDTNQTIKTIIVSAYTKTDIPYEISYIMKIDKILEKPVYLDRLKKTVQELFQQSIFSKKPKINKRKKVVVLGNNLKYQI